MVESAHSLVLSVASSWEIMSFRALFLRDYSVNSSTLLIPYTWKVFFAYLQCFPHNCYLRCCLPSWYVVICLNSHSGPVMSTIRYMPQSMHSFKLLFCLIFQGSSKDIGQLAAALHHRILALKSKAEQEPETPAPTIPVAEVPQSNEDDSDEDDNVSASASASTPATSQWFLFMPPCQLSSVDCLSIASAFIYRHCHKLPLGVRINSVELYFFSTK